MSAWEAGVLGLVGALLGGAGALLGGLITGRFSLRIASESRIAAEQAWMRDSRRGVYDRFLTSGQRMHNACDEFHDSLAPEKRAASDSDATNWTSAVREARADLFQVYAVVQIVAELPLVDAARVYLYRVMALRNILERKPRAMAMEHYERASQLTRDARHDTIDAMRDELWLDGSAKRPKVYNPFAGTDLESEW